MPKIMQVPMLMYHRLVPEAALQCVQGRDPYLLTESSFEEQLAYLSSKGYSTISLSDFIAHANGKDVPPQKPVIITFDDGNESDYTLAYPILRKYGFTATFFVVVDSISSPWMLTEEQIKEMSCNGMSIQSHTLTHSYLTNLSREQIEEELSKSKAVLESMTGAPVHFLSIPHGMYDNAVKKVAKETGYLAVVTSSLGINNTKRDLYSLKRIDVRRGISLSQFALCLQGQGMFWRKFMQLLKNMLKRILRIENYASLRRKLLQLK